MGPLSIRTRSSLDPSHLPGPALSKTGIPGKREETDVFLIGIRASCSYAALDHLSRSLKKLKHAGRKRRFYARSVRASRVRSPCDVMPH